VTELLPSDRLQPSLLDRLTDEEPEQRRESGEKRVLSLERLRESVRRDLAWLLNTGSLGSLLDLSAYPEVERSTLNFGIPDLTGKTASSLDAAAIVRVIRLAILQFEPRLLRNTVKVQVLKSESASVNTVCFGIQADLWAQPLPLRLYLRSELDLEDGEARVMEVAGS
jgi:type VI secretion system protein ImpF